jgi:ankyrin repeat protein
VEVLLNSSRKIKLEGRCEKGLTALVKAAAGGHRDILQLLIQKGAKVDAACKKGETALVMASANNDVEVMKLVLKARAKPNLCVREALVVVQGGKRKSRSASALDIALVNRSWDVAKVLLEGGASPNRSCQASPPLCQAVTGKNLGLVKLLVGAGADVNARAHDGRSALQIAVGEDDSAITRFLQRAGASCDIRDYNGSGALHHAVSKGSTALVKQLLEWNCDVNLKAKDGRTPLHLAAGTSAEMVLLLLLAGADVDVRARGRIWTPAFDAARRGEPETMRVLLTAGAVHPVLIDCGEDCEKGWTLLDEAKQQSNKPMVEYLVQLESAHRAAGGGGGRGF